MKKRSVVIAGHATSLSLEVEFYDALERLAKQRNMSVAALIKQIDFSRNGNLSSAVRVFILKALEENIQNQNAEKNTISSKDGK
jgi:predicted DNA-binding ribbon-helix-helix protein